MKASFLLFAVPELVSAFLLPQSYAPAQIHARELLGANYDTSFEFFEREADTYGGLSDLYARDEFVQPQFHEHLYRRGVDKGKGLAISYGPHTSHDEHPAPPSSLTPPAPAHVADHAGFGGEEYELQPMSQGSPAAPSYHTRDPRTGDSPQFPAPAHVPSSGNAGAAPPANIPSQNAQQSALKATQKAWGRMQTITQTIFKTVNRKPKGSKPSSAGASTKPETKGNRPGAIEEGGSSASAVYTDEEGKQVWLLVARVCTLDPEIESLYKAAPDIPEDVSPVSPVPPKGNVPITERVKQVCEGLKNPDTRHATIDGVLQFVQGSCMAGAGYAAATGQAHAAGAAMIGAGGAIGGRGLNDFCHGLHQAVQEGAAQHETASSRPTSVRQKRDLELAYLNYALFLEDL